MPKSHALAIDDMLPRIEKIDGLRRLAEEVAQVVGQDGNVELGVIDFQKVQQIPLGHLHNNRNVAVAAPDMFDTDEVYVVELADSLQGADFLRGDKLRI